MSPELLLFQEILQKQTVPILICILVGAKKVEAFGGVKFHGCCLKLLVSFEISN